jgi:uncharacterized protein (TIGR02646 family)
MIPVKQHPEPGDFDQKVRQPGQKWLKSLSVPENGVLPAKTIFKNFWKRSQENLWGAYRGICAYLCIYFEFSTGASSTDHFIPKTQDAWLAYEWSNFRLSCLKLNRDKSTRTILDPFRMKPEMFYLELSSGEIYPNPALTSSEKTQVTNTIAVLKLNDPIHKSMRQKHYLEYLKHKLPQEYLQCKSPLIYAEAKCQGLL